MMGGKIVFDVEKGTFGKKSYEYEGKQILVIGRASDCAIVAMEPTVSRYHCIIDIADSSVMVRDFGSLNGTFISGIEIGRRLDGHKAKDASFASGTVISMKDSDVLGLGKDCSLRLRKIGGDEKELDNEAGGEIKRCVICGDEIIGGKVNTRFCSKCLEDRTNIVRFIAEEVEEKAKITEEISGYEKIRLLGKGGMGQVWLVKEREKKKRMALKIMLPKTESDERRKKLFIREARLASQLIHRNIVTIHKCSESDNVFYILMELCKGGDLRYFTEKKGGKLKVDPATSIILNVLDGLIYAHNVKLKDDAVTGEKIISSGIVHRDLKPTNIFLTSEKKNPTAKIGDFGLSKAFELAGLSGHTVTGARAGPPVFMPRQLINNFKYALPEVDVWAAAACFYYMLTGKYTKEYSSTVDAFCVALTTPSTPIRKVEASVPKKLAEVIDYALIETPSIKVKTAAEFKEMILNAI
jgi:pSer/pThr/pTyr-binding forkhead associated (FHA) protein/tRNA A-37 threonylcarbamoyl transferase component Bud32